MRQFVLTLALALLIAALGSAPAHAASSVWYPDAAGDEHTSEPERDLVGLRVEDDGVLVALTAEFETENDPTWGWVERRDGWWRIEFSNGTKKVRVDWDLKAVGDCPAIAAHAPGSISIVTTRSCFGGLDGGTPTFRASLQMVLIHGPSEVDSVSALVPTPPAGYRMVTASGDVHAFGGATNSGGISALGPAVDIDASPAGGYWILYDYGYIKNFGDATFMRPTVVVYPPEHAVSMSVTPSGRGAWVFTDAGRVIVTGEGARDFGGLAGTPLNAPIIDSVATPSGDGYYMVASDGGVFAFGDAVFRGSMGGIRLNAPVQSLVPDPDGVGYWLVASDGGVFAFDAEFRGSMGSVRLNQPVTGMIAHGNGYVMVGEDGGIFNFSNSPFFGSLGSRPPASPVVAVTSG